jgi:hypothetical protein
MSKSKNITELTDANLFADETWIRSPIGGVSGISEPGDRGGGWGP